MEPISPARSPNRRPASSRLNRFGRFRQPAWPETSRMNVVYLNPVGALGGAERSLLDILVSVRQTMPAAQFPLVVPTPGPLIQEAEKVGVRRLLRPMPPHMGDLGVMPWT